MTWYIKVLKKYAVFNGRASRSEYWFFTLFNVIISILLLLLDIAIGTYNPVTGLGLLNSVYGLLVFIPVIAVMVRRLHDTDRSGWFALMLLIPIIGPIVLLVFTVLDSSIGDNRFGSSPKLEVIDS